MTAEIAVMNKLAVALAADSAVTIGRGDKVFNTANKLFMLSKHEPVGIMVYNNAELLGLPWETIIKVFREKLGSRSLPTLEEYADEFVKFIGESWTLFPDDVQQDYFAEIVTAYLMILRDFIDSRVKAVIDESGYITRRQISAIRRQVLDDGIKQLSKSTSLSSVSEHQAASLVARHDSLIQRTAKQVFERHPLTEANPPGETDLRAHMSKGTPFFNLFRHRHSGFRHRRRVPRHSHLCHRWHYRWHCQVQCIPCVAD